MENTKICKKNMTNENDANEYAKSNSQYVKQSIKVSNINDYFHSTCYI